MSIKALSMNNNSSSSGSRATFISKVIPMLSLVAALLCLFLGGFCLAYNSLEAYPLPFLGFLSIMLLLLFLHVRHVEGVSKWRIIILSICCAGSAAFLWVLPEYVRGAETNGVIHHSFFSAVLLFAVGIPALCFVLFHLLGAGPRAEDISRYPLILLPVLLVLAAYGLVLSRILIDGVPKLDWDIISTAYNYIPGETQPGMRNHIIGTFVLIGMTAVLALPPGVGAGIIMSEHSGWLANVIRVSVTTIRAISVFILGLGAYALIIYSQNTPFVGIVDGFPNATSGTFLVATIFLALLIIPVIARTTEEGCRSTPGEIREGSLALGATEEYTLTHITLPWSLPNIMTGLLLGCAEVAGSVVVLMFIAGYGQFGIGPLGETTSLSIFIFKCKYGLRAFTRSMAEYQMAAALLLLIITLGFSAAALILRSRFDKRYRGT